MTKILSFLSKNVLFVRNNSFLGLIVLAVLLISHENAETYHKKGIVFAKDVQSRIATTKTIELLGRSRPVDTGLTVQLGSTIIITATGQVENGSGSPSFPASATPDGNPLPAANPIGSTPLPQVSSTSLIGAIGGEFSGDALLDDGRDVNPSGISGSDTGYPGLYGPGYVGSSFVGFAKTKGNIFIAVNDAPISDNSGSFIVTITIIYEPRTQVFLPLTMK